MKSRSKRYKDIKKLSIKGKKIELKDIFDLVKKSSTVIIKHANPLMSQLIYQ